MSSAAIMAIIKQKQAELQQLKTTKVQVTKAYDAVDCMANKFVSAGALMNEAGSIGGKPFDNGATSKVGQDLKIISNNALGLSNQVSGAISDLEGEISELYAAYQAALEAERRAREAAERAERAANEAKKTSVRSKG